ncbi:DNA cytosine methyltransferase [Chloroflexota bacterium]
MNRISMFMTDENSEVPKKKKRAKLGRYERIRQEHENDLSDTHKIFVDIEDGLEANKTYTFIDLFSGAGGITLGFEQSGYIPAASIEISEIASATHRRNFPNCRHYCGDIREFDPSKVLKDAEFSTIHVVVGGPPCQGFSVAGQRDPKDERNKLFKEFVRVVDQVKPWYVVLENVPGILTMQKGAVKDAIKEAFKEIGYPDMSIAVLESASYGVPQIRPRAIFIANRFGLENPYPKPQLRPEQYRPIESAIDDLPDYTPIPEINHEWTRHSKAYMERIAKVPPGGSLYESFLDAFKRQYPGLPSMTIKENHGGTHIHPHLNRVISAREMARLQSFPDTFIFEGTMKKAMWQIGNAVPPRLAECIGSALRPSLERASAILSGRMVDLRIERVKAKQLRLAALDS